MSDYFCEILLNFSIVFIYRLQYFVYTDDSCSNLVQNYDFLLIHSSFYCYTYRYIFKTFPTYCSHPYISRTSVYVHTIIYYLTPPFCCCSFIIALNTDGLSTGLITCLSQIYSPVLPILYNISATCFQPLPY